MSNNLTLTNNTLASLAASIAASQAQESEVKGLEDLRKKPSYRLGSPMNEGAPTPKNDESEVAKEVSEETSLKIVPLPACHHFACHRFDLEQGSVHISEALGELKAGSTSRLFAQVSSCPSITLHRYCACLPN